MVQGVVVFLLAVAFVSALCMALFCLHQRDHACKASLCMLTLSVSMFLLGYLLEMQSKSLEAALLATKIQYLGIPFIGPAFLLLVLDLTGIKKYRFPLEILLLLSGALSCFLVFTCEYHTLHYADYRFITDTALPHLSVSPGPFYYLMQLLTNITNVTGCVILINHYRRMASLMRTQVFFLLLGGFMPSAANLLYLLGVEPWGVNLTPFAIFIMLLAHWISISSQDVFGILPKAVDMALVSMPEAFILLDHNYNLLHANPAANRLFPGLETLESSRQIMVLEEWPQALYLHQRTGNNDIVQRFALERGEGLRHYEASISQVPSYSGISGWMLLIRDISDTIKLMDRLEELAFTDGLTQISNRRYFMDIAEREFAKHRREQKSLAVMILDIDHFKQVNDIYGHLVGDEVLKALAITVSGMLRSFDLFARYGGEEFVLLVSNVECKTSLEIAERIREAMQHVQMDFEGNSFTITISIGVAWIDNAKLSVTDAIRQADTALYQAKESGRNRVVILYDSLSC